MTSGIIASDGKEETKVQIHYNITTSRKYQADIIAKFPEELLIKKKLELCLTCSRRPCGLLPITSQGEDCPYHLKKPPQPETGSQV